MEVYFLKTNGNNLVIALEEGFAKIYDGSPSGKYGGVDLCSESTVDSLRERYRSLDESGDLNDFSDLGGEEVEIDHDLYNELATRGELIFSNEGHPEIYSVQIEYDGYSNETFCGTEEECREYIEKKGYNLGEDCRIALLSLENFFSDMTLDIIEE